MSSLNVISRPALGATFVPPACGTVGGTTSGVSDVLVAAVAKCETATAPSSPVSSASVASVSSVATYEVDVLSRLHGVKISSVLLSAQLNEPPLAPHSGLPPVT